MKAGSRDKFIIAALVAAAAGHLGYLAWAPRERVHESMDALSEDGMVFNRWIAAERFQDNVQGAPTPNPDLMTAACVFDVSPGPVLIELAPWDDYWSLSLYNADGDPFYTISDREIRGSARLVLTRHERDAPEHEGRIVETPSARGMAVLRRLAPSPSRHAQALRVAREDVCGNLAALRAR